MNSSNHHNEQIIDFNNVEEQCPTHIFSDSVVVYPSNKTLEIESKASNKITTQNVVDYSWQDRYCLGHLITYHAPTKLIAYVLSISNSYMIRILNEENSSRCLIKDFSGEIIDISFSKSKVPYVASIDVNGYVKVNKICVQDELLEPQLVLKVEPRPLLSSAAVRTSNVCYSRVMWCWHSDVETTSADSDDGEAGSANISLLLGIVHASSFDVLQVDTIEAELITQNLDDEDDDNQEPQNAANSAVSRKYEPHVTRDQLAQISRVFQEQYAGSANLHDLFLPYLTYTAPPQSGTVSDSRITCFAISSDAGAFAAGLKDGTVRFFTLDGSAASGLKEEYSWRPFENENAWSLLFLDDCRPGTKLDSYWCHVVVGSAFNRTLKLYRCDKWDCIQTLRFCPSPVSGAFSGITSVEEGSCQQPPPACLLSAHIDESACFLLASDIRRKALYVLELGSLPPQTTSINCQQQHKLLKSVQEFVLSEPLLSFDINTVSAMSTPDGFQQVVIKLFTITKAAFQKMRVSYHSRGHRMMEVPLSVTTGGPAPLLIDLEPSGTPDHSQDHDPLRPASSVTRVSTLACSSVHSSFQDPAIIATRLHHRPDGDDEVLLPLCGGEVPAALQHLFSAAAAAAASASATEPGGADSGAESDDEDEEEEDEDEQEQDEESTLPEPPVRWRQQEQSDVVLLTALAKQEHALEVVAAAVNRLEHRQSSPNMTELEEAVVRRVSVQLGARLTEEVTDKLGAVGAATREYVAELTRDRRWLAQIAEQASEAASRAVLTSCSEIVKRDVAPALDRAVQRLGQEAGTAMSSGAASVAAAVEKSQMESVARIEAAVSSQVDVKLQQLRTEHNRLMRAEVEEMRSRMEAHTAAMTTRLEQALSGIEESLAAAVRESAQQHQTPLAHAESSASLLPEASAANGSAAATVQARQKRVAQLLEAGNPAAAVTEALACTDLGVTLSTLGRLQQPRLLLSGSPHRHSPLPFPVILSLLQQISRNFADKFDLKFDFLFEGLLSLDMASEPLAGGAALKALRGVSRRLQQHLASTETSPVVRDRCHVLLRLLASKLDPPASTPL